MGAAKSTPAPLKVSSRAATSRRSAARRWYKSAGALTRRSVDVGDVHANGVRVYGAYAHDLYVYVVLNKPRCIRRKSFESRLALG